MRGRGVPRTGFNELRIPISEFRTLAVRRARHDQPVHGFHVPSALDEPSRQPIEELWVRGAAALTPKVFGRFDESGTPELQPETPASARVAGTLRLAELGEYFGIDLEHEEVDSVGGLVLALARTA